MEKNSIGLLELSSIATGLLVGDTMLKAAGVELLIHRTICSGKYLVLVGGDVASVEASVAAGKEVGGGAVIDSCLIANIDQAIFPAISGTVIQQSLAALGVIESFSVASLFEGADVAAKAADVQLLEIRLAMALGGKAFVKISGDVGSVEAAVEAGAARISARGMLVNKVVIPAPSPQLLGESV
jgi:microcompartment protein CcmL/EutN